MTMLPFLNIKTRILLNGILSVVISILLVIAILSFLLWKQSEKRARDHINHAIRVIDLQFNEMASELKEIAIKIGNQQEYASKINFIQENKENKFLQDMLEGERRELSGMLYDAALTGSIASITLFDDIGEWICNVSLNNSEAYLSVNHPSETIQQAVIPIGKTLESEYWSKGTQKLHFDAPSKSGTEITIDGNRIGLTATAPLQARLLNPQTLKEESVQKGFIQVCRYLDDSFIQRVSSLTDTMINLFAGNRFSVGNLRNYNLLNEKETARFSLPASHFPFPTFHFSLLKENPLFKEIHIDKTAFFEGIVPIISKNQTTGAQLYSGAFSVLLSQEETRKAQRQMIQSLFLVALIGILITMPLTYFLAIKEIIYREHTEKELARYREHLEELVTERTAELEKANSELDQKNTALNESLEAVEEANRAITESIQYAKVIQRSVLHNGEFRGFKNFGTLPVNLDSFFIWMPCDIVSGDIFYTDVYDNGFIIAVIDCTGHGVPGAFMTMLAFSNLRRITRTEKCNDPAEILKRLNYSIKTTLQQDTEYALSDDGMDAAIVKVQLSVNSEQKMENMITDDSSLSADNCLLTFAGAKLPLFYICNDELTVIKGDKESVGYKSSDLDFEFTNHTIPVEKGMVFYLASDGFTDQLGGEKGLHFGSRRFKDMLKENAHLSFSEQKEIFVRVFNDYRGDNEMQDDVTVVGFGFRDD